MQDNSALLIIDVQRGFINEHTKDIPSLVEMAQLKYDIVWIAKLEYGENSPFLTIRQRTGFSDVENPTELAFTPRSDAKIILKHGYSAVVPEFLEKLKTSKTSTIDLMGVDTDQCVLATALALFDAKITPRIIVNYCASTGGVDMHEKALAIMRRALGSDKVLYQCSECGLHYEDEAITKQCEVFCKEHHGCSLEIGTQSIERKA